ncbi:large ribosomal subunit protein uL2z-like [Miscanthus floridulus]|uniref:large ribosomal subunit protein uL2z-like n=1 Tax=Miscanthus floridulus TaxID=154761 RepID=UPI003458CC07
MYTGQFVYCGRRATLSIGNIPPFCGILEGTVICNAEHHTADGGAPPLGTTPLSSATTPTATPPPGHLGTTPSSSAATLTTASGQEAPPTKGGTWQTTAKSTTYSTHQCSFSFGSSDSSARATISSTLDDLWLDITL